MSGPFPELDALGVRYHAGYGTARANFVQNICIPWKPSQWAGVVHREGQWLGTCCSTISNIRDRLLQILADGGWVGTRDFATLIDYLKSHDGFAEWFEDGFVPTEETTANPLYLLVRVWAVVKNKRWASWLDVPGEPGQRADRPGRSLELALGYYNMVGAFHPAHHENERDRERAEFDHKVQMRLALARVIPPLRALTEELAKNPMPGVGGVAIVRKTDRDTVLETVGGPAIYVDVARAKEIIDFWCTNDQTVHGKAPPKAEDFEVRPVTVDLDHGIVFPTPP